MKGFLVSNLYLDRMKIMEWVLRNPQLENNPFFFDFSWYDENGEFILCGFAQSSHKAEERAEEQTLLSQIAKAVGANKLKCVILNNQKDAYKVKSEKMLIMGEQLGQKILNEEELMKPMHQIIQLKNSSVIISHAPAELLQNTLLKAKLWNDLKFFLSK